MRLPAFPDLAERNGARIGRYKLLEQIGEGGFGVVWRAEQDEPVRRHVALKIIKPGMDTQEVIARFEVERQALAMMDHPNIAKVLDGGTTETGRPYFVMELVCGQSITEFCDARRMAPTERLELFRKVCLAVQHAHQKGIIHRDLKPSNILVTVHDDVPVPKVIDFGIAKALETRLTERTHFTRFNQWLGTPAYMSPEQAGLGGLDVDTRSDVYSLGTILFELLTGHTPFSGLMLREKGYEAILGVIREEDAPRASKCLSTLPRGELQSVARNRARTPEKLGHILKGELDWVLLRALERDRSRRYATANALAKDLQRYVAGEPVSAAPRGFAYQAGKLIRRHWKGASIAATVTALVIAGSVTSAVFGWRASNAEQAATQRLRQERETLATAKLRQAQQCCENGEVDRGLLMFSEALAIARQAEAKSLADACSLNLSAWLPEAHTLLHQFRHPQKVNCVAVSPDGKIVASACDDGAVRFWDLETGQTAGPPLQHPGPVNVLTFDPRGSSLFTGCVDGVARMWEIPASGTPVAKREFIHIPADRAYEAWGRRGISSVSVSKDGSRLATAGYDGWLHIWETDDSTKPIRSRNFDSPLTSAAFDPHDEDTVGATTRKWRLSLWNWKKDQVMQRSLGAVHWHCDFDPSHHRLVVGSMQDHHAQQFDVSTLQPTGVPMSHRDALSWVAYSPDGSQILTASSDNTARVWDASSGAPVGSIIRHPDTLTCCTWSPSASQIVTACYDGIVRVWRVARCVSGPVLQHPGWVRDIEFGPDSETVVTSVGGSDFPGENARLWNAMTGESLANINTARFCTYSVFGIKGDVIYTAVGHDPIHCYDVATGRLIRKAGDGLGVQRLAISCDGSCLASSSSDDAGVHLWNAATLERIGPPLPGNSPEGPRYSFHQQVHHAACFTFWPDGHSILTGNCDGALQLWSTETCAPVGAPKRYVTGICALAVASDGKLLAVGGTDHQVRLLDWESLRPVGAELEHAGRITAVTFTPNRQLVLTSSVDGTARVWHVPSGLPVGPPLRHGGVVNTVKCSPNGFWAATASDDRTAKIWRLPTRDRQEVEATVESLEALTGITANGASAVRSLSIEEWQMRRSASTALVEHLLKAAVVKPSSNDSNNLSSSDDSKSMRDRFARNAKLEDAAALNDEIALLAGQSAGKDGKKDAAPVTAKSVLLQGEWLWGGTAPLKFFEDGRIQSGYPWMARWVEVDKTKFKIYQRNGIFWTLEFDTAFKKAKSIDYPGALNDGKFMERKKDFGNGALAPPGVPTQGQ